MMEEKYSLGAAEREDLFRFLEQLEAESPWQEDYSVDVCDGFSYEIRLTFSDHHNRWV